MRRDLKRRRALQVSLLMTLTVVFLMATGCATTKVKAPEKPQGKIRFVEMRRGEPAPADGAFANDPTLREVRRLQLMELRLNTELDEAPTQWEKIFQGWKGFVLGLGVGYVANDVLD